MKPENREYQLGLLWALLLLVSLSANAQAFPTKSVRFLVGSVGSGSDLMARSLAPGLSQRWGQPVVIENRPQPVIHAAIVAKATPDGYTLLMGQFSSHASPPSLYKNLAYDPVKDFAPITLVSRSALLLVAHPFIPAATVQEFIVYVRQRPGVVRYAAQSASSNGRLTMELFRNRAGLDMLYVPYRSPAMSLQALLAQEADVSFLSIAASISNVRAGKLKAYGITSKTRFSKAPDIPTLIESGFPGFEATLWFAVFAPARTPPNLVKKLNSDIVGILNREAIRSALLAQGSEVSPSTPEELAMFVENEIQRWGVVIRAAGIKPE